MKLKLVLFFLTSFSVCVVCASRPKIALHLETEESTIALKKMTVLNIKDFCSLRRFATIDSHQYVRIRDYHIKREVTPSFIDCADLIPKRLADGTIAAVDDSLTLLRSLLYPSTTINVEIGEIYTEEMCEESFQVYPITINATGIGSVKFNITPVVNHAFFLALLRPKRL